MTNFGKKCLQLNSSMINFQSEKAINIESKKYENAVNSAKVVSNCIEKAVTSFETLAKSPQIS